MARSLSYNILCSAVSRRRKLLSMTPPELHAEGRDPGAPSTESMHVELSVQGLKWHVKLGSLQRMTLAFPRFR